jgi:threonylcarbamoyladenosine tRNA methylthiotransferase MtaB
MNRSPVIVKRFRLVTFGCKVNQYESEVLMQQLHRLAWRAVGNGESCDAVIVNTCTVTGRTDRKCRQAIRSLMRTHPGAQVLVTGCYAVAEPDALVGIPGVTGVYPDKAAVVNHLAAASGESPPLADEVLTQRTTRTRALLKVQDGCDAFCAYCIIPHVRGHRRSKPLPAALAEARTLLDAGHREIVLTGIHLGLYGRDLDGDESLTRLCEALLTLDGLDRLRLSSIELSEVTDDLADLLAGDNALCPHLHVPLQSGDDGVLARMNRTYSAGAFGNRAPALTERVPDLSLTTDVMVGFPGEDETAFAHTVALCRKVGFSKMHVFPFSPRAGTAAADMPGRPVPADLERRRQELLARSDELGARFRRAFVNRTVAILVEGQEGGSVPTAEGLTANFLRARVKGSSRRANSLIRARVLSADAHLLSCEPVGEG